MKKIELLEYMLRHFDKYVREFEDIQDGISSFDCLVSMVEDGYISASDLPKHGFYLNWDEN